MSVKAVSVGWERVKSDCIGLLNEWKAGVDLVAWGDVWRLAIVTEKNEKESWLRQELDILGSLDLASNIFHHLFSNS